MVDLRIVLSGRKQLAEQIYAQVRAAVLNRHLRAGEPLPPTRELAARLGVSRNTVGAAYERLVAEGFLSARVGSGTYVSELALPRDETGHAVPGSAATHGPLHARPRHFPATVPTALYTTVFCQGSVA